MTALLSCAEIEAYKISLLDVRGRTYPEIYWGEDGFVPHLKENMLLRDKFIFVFIYLE